MKSSHSREWLVALPDHPAAAAAVAALDPITQRVNHPSGRPWLVGEWESTDLRTESAGRTSIAILGPASVTPQRLSRIAERTTDAVALDELSFAGCFHLIASVDGVVRIQGSLSGLRRVVHAEIGGVTVAATRADVLAALSNAELDRRRLVLRFLLSEIPLHTMNAPLWQDVHAVDEDSCLLLTPDGRARSRRRWQPPPDDQPLHKAAEALRTALVDSVRTRVTSGPTVTADLSGGLDSTTLCFLAARDGRPLTALTKLAADVGDDDPQWADLAAEHLPGLRRITIPFTDIPAHYSDVLEPLPPTEEPFPGVEDRPMYRAMAARLAAAGSQMHLTGDGGDETLMGGATGVFELLRRSPLAGLRYLRAYRALEHWRWRDIAMYARERREAYPEWLARRARSIIASPLDDEGASNLVQLPPWATPEAVGLARELLLEEAERTQQRGHNWTAHHTVLGVQLCASLVRAASPLYAAEGIRLNSPYLDDAVLHACMTARAHERRTPWAYKPLLVAAMRGIVPDRCLARSTKAEGSNVEHAGLRTNAEKLVALCEDSRLGRLGLIDPRVLREICSGFQMRMFTPYAISTTASTERWLRDQEQLVTTEAKP
ncbi:asparagine synthase (glutamine-hydrolysing) [Saccharopolyspora antimicrobica]|uniref:asparagine synthase (glutamine-hydrolyzing) n=1 Tax=Saccharopolyspora antimicrobica TaxID=455193 RepID=A0A1I5IEU9_9PSEU|nr:asparagine synthase (glutamine-hydrolysing) [Saccharopolyspora antimicrobica]SFO59115.1 asparagine synthase (glutamine-hydrolysing) [Saccharopolyspora antimicrobica]